MGLGDTEEEVSEKPVLKLRKSGQDGGSEKPMLASHAGEEEEDVEEGDERLEEEDEEAESQEMERRDELTEKELEELGAELLYLCKHNGDLARVEDLIDMGAPINFRKPGSEWTPLMWAVSKNSTAIASVILQNGGSDSTHDVEHNSSDDARTTAMHLAAYCGNEAIVSMLLQLGFPCNKKDSCGNTPLHLACANGHYGVVQVLLSQGLDLSSKNLYGNPPLALATDKRVRELLSKIGGQQRCNETHRLFTPSARGFLCYSCNNLFAQECTEQFDIPQEAGSPFFKRIRCCKKCIETIHKAESELLIAMKISPEDSSSLGELQGEDIPLLEKALIDAQAAGANVELISEGRIFLKRLTLKSALRTALKDLESIRPLQVSFGLAFVSSALQAAREGGVEEEEIRKAEETLEAAEAEIYLNGNFLICSQIPVGGQEFRSTIFGLSEAIREAEALPTNSELLGKAKELCDKLSCELDLQGLIPAYTAQKSSTATESGAEGTAYQCFDGSKHQELTAALQHAIAGFEEHISKGKKANVDSQRLTPVEEELVKLKAAYKEEYKLQEERRKLAEEEAAKKAKKAAAKKAKKK